MGFIFDASQLISKRWRVILSVLFIALLVFEVARFVQRVNIVDVAGFSVINVSLISIALILCALIMTMFGKKLAPFLISFVLLINFFTSTIYPNSMIDKLKIPFAEMVGMPIAVFYAYMILQAIIFTSLLIYYFTDHLYGDESKIRVRQRDSNFGNFVNDVIVERRNKHDSLWQE